MKKFTKVFTSFIFIILSFRALAQETFIANPHDTTRIILAKVIEFNSNFYAAGINTPYNNTDTSKRISSAYISKYNKSGSKLSSYYLNDSAYNYQSSNIFEFDGFLYVIATGESIIDTKLSLIKLDTAFNLVSRKNIDLANSDYSIFMIQLLQQDSLIFITGSKWARPVGSSSPNSFVFKANLNGDSISYKEFYNTAFENINKLNDSLFIIPARIVKYYGSGFYTINRQLDSVGFFSNYSINDLYSFKSFKKISANRFIFSGGHENNKKECIWLTDSLYNTIDYKEMGDSTHNNCPAINGCIDFNGKFIYQSWTEDFNPFLYDLNNSANHLTITKLDTQLNQIWTYNYGDDESYFMVFHIIATSDGGCLATGYSSNQFHQENNLDYFLLKIDSLGNYVWMQKMPANILSFQIFPNPSSDQFYLKNLPQGERVERLQIFDMTGKLVHSMGAVQAQEAVDIRQLPQGMYLVEVRLTHGQSLTTKLVKASGEK